MSYGIYFLSNLEPDDIANRLRDAGFSPRSARSSEYRPKDYYRWAKVIVRRAAEKYTKVWPEAKSSLDFAQVTHSENPSQRYLDSYREMRRVLDDVRFFETPFSDEVKLIEEPKELRQTILT